MKGSVEGVSTAATMVGPEPFSPQTKRGPGNSPRIQGEEYANPPPAAPARVSIDSGWGLPEASVLSSGRTLAGPHHDVPPPAQHLLRTHNAQCPEQHLRGGR